MSVSEDLRRYVRLAEALFLGDVPKELKVDRVQALIRLDSGEAVEDVVRTTRFGRRHLLVWHEVVQSEGLHGWLGKKEPLPERLRHARSGIAQMLQGNLAESHFESLSTDLLGSQGFRVEDQRGNRRLASLSGRMVEETIATQLGREPWAEMVRRKIRESEFRAISARRAYDLMREKLFDRVHALRLRGFNRLFRGAEINMHLSLSTEMIAYTDVLRLLADRGPVELAVRLDRGEI